MTLPNCFGRWGKNALCGLCEYGELCDNIDDEMFKKVINIKEEDIEKIMSM